MLTTCLVDGSRCTEILNSSVSIFTLLRPDLAIKSSNSWSSLAFMAASFFGWFLVDSFDIGRWGVARRITSRLVAEQTRREEVLRATTLLNALYVRVIASFDADFGVLLNK